jgi:hypothetical protein
MDGGLSQFWRLWFGTGLVRRLLPQSTIVIESRFAITHGVYVVVCGIAPDGSNVLAIGCDGRV